MIDCHSHLDDKAFNDEVDAVIASSKSSLKAIVTCASSFHSNQKTLDIVNCHENYVFGCFGLDPVHCLREEKIRETEDFIRENIKSVTAIGEVGIDYHWEKNEISQIRNFETFIKLSEELNRPLVIHARDSMDEVLRTLDHFSPPSVMMHCFSGDESQADECIDRGYFISFNTNSCFIEDRKSLISHVPLDNMLSETDSPYNHPERKGRNEPVNVVQLIDLISKIKGESTSNIDKIIDRNAEKAFKIRLV